MDYVLTTCLHLSLLLLNYIACNFRNASDNKYIPSNTQFHYNSFLPSEVRDWYELPHTFCTTRNATSVSAEDGLQHC